MCQIVKRKSLFSNSAPEIHIFNSRRHQILLSVAKQFQDSVFLFDINNENFS